MAESLYDNNIIQRIAEEKKEWGNNLFKLKKYSDALAMYDEAIQLCPENAVYYGNRSACYIMLNMHKKALDDAKKAVSLDSAYIKGYIRIARCCIHLGDRKGAINAVVRASERGGEECVASEQTTLKTLFKLNKEVNSAKEVNNVGHVMFCVNRCLVYSPSCTVTKLTKVDCLLKFGQYQEAWKIAFTCIPFNNSDPELIYMRGLCLYYEDDCERAVEHFKQVLRLAPNHKKATNSLSKISQLRLTRSLGNEAFKMGSWQEAERLYREALTYVVGTNKTITVKLIFNIAMACFKLNENSNAEQAFLLAFDLYDDFEKSLLTRAKCYTDLGEYEAAYKDYEMLYDISKSEENKRLLDEAKLALEKWKCKDYYKILGLDKTACLTEIKKAYRKLALRHHPDRHPNAHSVVLREQERRFKEIAEVHAVLDDPFERSRYNRRHALESVYYDFA